MAQCHATEFPTKWDSEKKTRTLMYILCRKFKAIFLVVIYRKVKQLPCIFPLFRTRAFNYHFFGGFQVEILSLISRFQLFSILFLIELTCAIVFRFSILIKGRTIMCLKSCLPAFSIGKQ